MSVCEWLVLIGTICFYVSAFTITVRKRCREQRAIDARDRRIAQLRRTSMVRDEDKGAKMVLYVIVCTRHESIFGKNWALFWGCDERRGDYISDPERAHRFTEEEAMAIQEGGSDIAIPIDVLGLEPGYTEPKEGIVRLMEKGQINRCLHKHGREQIYRQSRG